MELFHLNSSFADEMIGRFFREKFSGVEVPCFFQVCFGLQRISSRHETNAGYRIDSELLAIAGYGLKVDTIGVPLGKDVIELLLAV